MDEAGDIVTAAGALVTAATAVGFTIIGIVKGKAIISKLVK